MPLFRDNETRLWHIEIDGHEEVKASSSHPSYFDALPRYLSTLDPLFENARNASEFEFIIALLGLRGMQDAGWDPYETTVSTISAMRHLHSIAETGEQKRHLQLWVYGHIVEASEPYELIGNLARIAAGGRFKFELFPPHGNGRPLSPGEKISCLNDLGTAAGVPHITVPLREIWNRDLRNSIFHADYSIHGASLRTIRPTREYSNDEVLTYCNRALGYHEAITVLKEFHLGSYEEPTIIPVHPEFSPDPADRAIVIVRTGEGATGMKDAWTANELAGGKIPHRIGRFTREELELLDADPQRAILPRRHD